MRRIICLKPCDLAMFGLSLPVVVDGVGDLLREGPLLP